MLAHVLVSRIQLFLFVFPPRPTFLPCQDNWEEDEEKEEQSEEQEMAVDKEINGDSDLDPENESEEE